MAALQEVSENWDDDFEFQVEKRKLSTATAKSEATENWDDDFEDSRQSPKKIIQRHREESWDDEDDDEEEENAQFPLFLEEDRTVTARSRRAALPRLSTGPPRSPTSSVFSVPTTIHTYSSTAHLCPTSAFALIPPSPPIHKERERRRLRKKSRPKPQAVFELVEISSQEKPSLPEVDLPRSASEFASRRTGRSDLSTDERPPLIVTHVADTSIAPSSEPVTIPQTPTKGTALLSRIGSVKKWGVRRKRGDSTAPTDIELDSMRSSPSAGVVRSARSRSRSRSKVKSERGGDGSPTGDTFYLRTPNASRTDLNERRDTPVNRKASEKGKDSFVPSASGNSKLPTLTTTTTPTKLVKRKSFGFVHLGKGFGGHRGGVNEVMRESGRKEDDGEGKQDATKAENQKDRMKYAALGLGHAGVRSGGGGECERSESTPKIDTRTPRRSSSRFVDRDKENKDKEADGVGKETLVVTPSTSSSIFPSISSLSRDNDADGVGAVPPLPPLSPSKLLRAQSPSQSQQSVSLGRSAANVAGSGNESTGLSFASGSGSGAGLPRRNSLGDLKIPARISQAQVGLRRDLGMVREFASNVEQLKELQNTYNTLVVELQALLDTYVQLRQPVPLPPQPAGKSPPSNFFAQLKSRPKSRVRSNTVGSTTTREPDVMGPGSLGDPSSQVVYTSLVETFWNINSRYKVPWECAELLIELGGGGGGDGDGIGVGVMSIMSAPPSATTSVSAPVIQQHLVGVGGDGKFNLKGRERAITLRGDESNHSTSPPLSPIAYDEPHTLGQSQPPSAIVSVTSSSSMPGVLPSRNATSSSDPSLASPPSMSWRVSTGRHDLSQRQLVLLRDMLNNNGGASIVDASDNEGGLRPPPPPHFPVLAEDPESHPSPLSPHPSSRNQFVNRDWRWGDAMNSTITLSEEQNRSGVEGERRDRKMEKEKKRKSVRLGMSGIRDMLRSLKKAHVEELQQVENSNPGEVQSGQPHHHHHHHHHQDRLPNAVALALPMMHSTTSLNTQSSVDCRDVHNQRQAQQQQSRLPIPRIASHIRRRPRSSTGPDSMKSNKGPSPTSFSPSSFSVSKPSPRRPSLASIFRIGNNKTKPVNAALHARVVEEPSALPSAFGASEHDLSAAQCSSGISGIGCGDSNSTGEEEYWDRLDSASDLNAAAAKAPGIVDGAYDVSATVRGRVKTRTDKKKAGVSPYRSSHENELHNPVPPPLPASLSSTGLGNFLARHSILPKRSFSASQPNILSTGRGDGQRTASSRLSRHSNLEEQQPTDTASVEMPASLRISSSKSAPPQSKLLPSNFSASSTGSSSRPSSSRSTKFPNVKLGSVRSVPPLPVAPVSLLPHGQQPSSLSTLPDPKLGMIMTPENIRPLLENAKEVHMQLLECIVEIRALIEEGAAAIGLAGTVPQAGATC